MKIQIFSDIHLEFGDAVMRRTDADVIIAAGDIGLGAAGVPWLRDSGKPTVYVAGNHEFYGSDLEQVQRDIRAAVAGSAVRYLECERTDIGGVRFLGATLWTDYMGGNPALMTALQGEMNDYLQIRYREHTLTPTDLLAINRAARTWLEQELATAYAGPTVVVTHHAPLFASWRADPASLFKGAYCNDLSALIANYPIALWVHGHVHACSRYRAGTLRVVCNPRGYDGYQLVDGFDIGLTVAVDQP